MKVIKYCRTLWKSEYLEKTKNTLNYCLLNNTTKKENEIMNSCNLYFYAHLDSPFLTQNQLAFRELH